MLSLMKILRINFIWFRIFFQILVMAYKYYIYMIYIIYIMFSPNNCTLKLVLYKLTKLFQIISHIHTPWGEKSICLLKNMNCFLPFLNIWLFSDSCSMSTKELKVSSTLTRISCAYVPS
jgi:hypothetical protein